MGRLWNDLRTFLLIEVFLRNWCVICDGFFKSCWNILLKFLYFELNESTRIHGNEFH